MRQILFSIPVFGKQIPLYGYGVMLVLAMLSAVNLAAWRARREKLDPEVIYDLSLWILIGGLAGARLFYVVQYWGDRVNSFSEIFKIWEGGIVLYGGILSAAVAFFVFRARRKFPILPTMDVIAPSIALGVGIGRIGCFLNGCCWGDACGLPWAVRFPARSAPWWAEMNRGLIASTDLTSLPLHPTQIYSTIDGLVICLLLCAYYPLRRRDGEVFGLFMLTYPITRFLIEYLRNDEMALQFGMTISQLISIVIFAGGLIYWTWLSRRTDPLYADSVRDVIPKAA